MRFQHKERKGGAGGLCKTANLGARSTFKDFVERHRLESGRQAWSRARLTSRLRYTAVAQGKRVSAATLGKLKTQAVIRAMELCPEKIGLGIDDDFQIGLPTVEWRGRGRLHLPSSFLMSADSMSAA